MDLYMRFLAFEIVIVVETEEEYKKLLQRFHDLRLKSVKYLERVSFENLHKDAGIKVMQYGECCIEFSLGRGFTFGRKKEYVDYGCEVVSVQEFLDATEYE